MSESGSRRQGRISSGRHRPEHSGDHPDVVEQLRELKQRAVEVAGTVRDSAGSAAEQVRQRAADMTKAITSGVAEEAERLFDEQKGKAASKVARYGKAIHQAAHALHAVKADAVAEYVDSAAETVEGITDYLKERNLAQVLQDAGEVARRHPGLTLGGMFLTGLAAARFLKATAAGAEEGSDEASEGDRAQASGDEGEGEESRGGDEEEESPRGGRSGGSSRGR